MSTAAAEAAPATATGRNTAYSISDLAQEFGITTRAIRFYEDQGLINPGRRGRIRVYGPRDRTRLKLVLRGKRLGFSLNEIADILDLYDAEAGETGQLRYFLAKIEERREVLRRQRDDIDVTLSEMDRLARQCHEQLERSKSLP